MDLTLLAAVGSLGVWVVLVFIRPVGLGVVHVLLGLGVVLWIRWWALRDEKRQQ
ncbi:MAG TPA: hypothetical protein VGQ17_18710 [Gemmatimonadales bacterium]|jgi:hypothetical protein|nr:hypothetical protein [Gemmatimonadales bacterium]